jgi:hypothetical protein
MGQAAEAVMGCEFSCPRTVWTPVRPNVATMLAWVGASVVVTACAPLFRAVPQPQVTSPLSDGSSQGPFRASASLEGARPHRVTVRLTARCEPRFTVTATAGGFTRTAELGSSDGEWQRSLQQHFAPVAAPQQAAQRVEPEPRPGARVQTVGTVTPAGVLAEAIASVTVPGHWEAQATPEQRFEQQRASRCATPGTWSLTFDEPFDPGPTSVSVVAFSDVPQFVEAGSLVVEVERLEPPLRTESEHPPAVGAVWRPGALRWHHDGERFGWTTEGGQWEAPPSTPAVPSEHRPAAPNPGAQWADGSWSWTQKGWVWAGGQWFIPKVAPHDEPPKKNESPGRAPDGATWAAGGWSWKVGVGWEWSSGVWVFQSTPPGPPPAPRFELAGLHACASEVWVAGAWSWSSEGWQWKGGRWQVQKGPRPTEPLAGPGTPPAEGARWAAGTWQWDDCRGWAWAEGHWNAPLTAPIAKVEAPGEAPAQGQVWASGSWQWDGRLGWRWAEGHWFFPSRPSGAAPPLKDEQPGTPECAAWVWARGHWEWTSSGWSWQSGQWTTAANRSPMPAPRNEARGFSPAVDATWVSGAWRWNDCSGAWSWAHGSWVTPSHRERQVVMRREPPPSTVAVVHQDEPKTCAGKTAPPDARTELRPESPVAGAVWIPGFWRWADCEWSWTAGRWNAPPAPNMVWVPGATIELGRWVVQSR